MRAKSGDIREIMIMYGDIMLPFPSNVITCIVWIQNCVTTAYTLPLALSGTRNIFVRGNHIEYPPYSVRKPTNDIYNESLRDCVPMRWVRANLHNAELCAAIDQWIY